MKRLIEDGNPLYGKVLLNNAKLVKNGLCLLIGLSSLFYYKDFTALLASLIIINLTMYVGVVAYHRLLIHRSFSCPKWLEYLLIFFANLSGIGSPLKQISIHETRDWAQRQEKCHPYFSHKENLITDGFQQLFCELKLNNAPYFKIDEEQELFYKHLDKFWWLYQIPLGYLLYHLGSWSWVASGVFFKMFLVHFGHWFIAHLLHNYGQQPSLVRGAGVQGFNLHLLALLTFGESYHNNHHRCPNAANNAFTKGQIDPAWWLILLFTKLGLAHKVIMYETGSK